MTDLRTIEGVAVLGAGVMGHGIAQVCARAGYATVLYDLEAPLWQRGLDRIRAHLERGVARGKVAPEARDAALERLRGTHDLADAAGHADLVIEAAPESLPLKQRLFRDLAPLAPDDALLASNTSSLSIDAIADGAPFAPRLLGMHFFNPVPLMPLLEIVVGSATTDQARETALAVGERLGKDTIVVRDTPGFATSRLGVCLGLEAIRMLEAGVASAEDIDRAMELGYRHPMGPLRLTDLVGLDTRLHIARYLHETLGSPVFAPPALLERMVAAGTLGKKSGQGFYTWPASPPA